MKPSSNIIRFYHNLGMYKTIDVFSESGFRSIDFNADLAEFCDDTHDKAFYTELKKYANDRGIDFGQSHAPFASSYPDAQLSEHRFFEITTAIKHASYLDSPMIVVHPCQHIDYVVGGDNSEIYEYNIDFYKRLIPYSEEYGVKIALENINGKGGRHICSFAQDLVKMYEELNNDAFTVCFDVGHMNLLGLPIGDAIRTVGGRIKCLHVHDNGGISDDHTLPYCGKIDWEDVTKALADIGYSGNLNYEAGYFIRTTPPKLYPDAAKYMVSVANHLISKIEYYKALK